MNSATEKVDLTIFMIQLKSKSLKVLHNSMVLSALYVQLVESILFQLTYSVSAILLRNTRYLENLTEVKQNFVHLMHFYTV